MAIWCGPLIPPWSVTLLKAPVPASIVKTETLALSLLGTYRNCPVGSQRTWNELLPDPNEAALLSSPFATFTVNFVTVSVDVFAANANFPFGEISIECGEPSALGPLPTKEREPSIALME